MPTVRLLTPDDAPAYARLRREMLLDAPWSFTRTPDDDPGCNAPGVAASLAAPDGYAIAAAFNNAGLPVAAAGIRRPDPAKLAHRAQLWGVYVTPTHRRLGLAARVIGAAIAAARAWPRHPRIDSVSLTVSDRAPGALALYLKLGFTPWGHEPAAMRIGAESAGETHMLLTL